MAPHIYVVGQTASGKTRFSIELALKLGAEIINTDSLLFYKGLDIGTAKPSLDEQKKVTHHLIDTTEVGFELTAADYLTKASSLLKDSSKKYLMVGGSGFYINALDVGLLPIPETDPKVREEVSTLPNKIELLKKVDPNIFLKISENDLYRVGRALEVYKQTGKPLSVWQKEFKPNPLAKKIAFELDRDFLRDRITERANLMIKDGLVDEVKGILDKDCSGWKPLRSVGYAQVIKLLSGEIKTEVAMIEEIVNKTMQLSKRQKTWFKKDKSVKWFDFNAKGKAKDYVLKTFEENSWRV